MSRFDIYGLNPDADEDEAGIKRASENSMFLYFIPNFVQFGKDTTIGKASPCCMLPKSVGFTYTSNIMLNYLLSSLIS